METENPARKDPHSCSADLLAQRHHDSGCILAFLSNARVGLGVTVSSRSKTSIPQLPRWLSREDYHPLLGRRSVFLTAPEARHKLAQRISAGCAASRVPQVPLFGTWFLGRRFFSLDNSLCAAPWGSLVEQNDQLVYGRSFFRSARGASTECAVRRSIERRRRATTRYAAFSSRARV